MYMTSSCPIEVVKVQWINKSRITFMDVYSLWTRRYYHLVRQINTIAKIAFILKKERTYLENVEQFWMFSVKLNDRVKRL